jgi:hypothetical protein
MKLILCLIDLNQDSRGFTTIEPHAFLTWVKCFNNLRAKLRLIYTVSLYNR